MWPGQGNIFQYDSQIARGQENKYGDKIARDHSRATIFQYGDLIAQRNIKLS